MSRVAATITRHRGRGAFAALAMALIHTCYRIGDIDRSGRPRGFVPTNPVPQEEGSDILNVLRPHPQIEILLEGGVPLGYNSWLGGYPPAIRILGDAQHTHKVLIDGKEAEIRDGGVHRARGWDELGSHLVWCSNVSRSYSLIRLEQTWDASPAYVFDSQSGGGGRVAICGPLVRPFTIDATLGKVPTCLEVDDFLQNNPTLLGAIPGQVFVAVT